MTIGKTLGIEIIIEGEPVAQGRPKFTRLGHAYTPAKSKKYRDKVVAAAKKVMNGQEPTLFALCVEIIIYRSIPTSWSKKKQEQAANGEIRPLTKPDIDNYAKMMLDGMNGIVYNDDNQILRLIVDKFYSRSPKAVIRVYPLL